MKTIKILLVAFATITMTSCDTSVGSKKSLETEIDSVSYAIGLDMANQMKKNFEEVNTDLYMQGYKSGMTGADLLIEEKDIRQILTNFFQKKNNGIAAKKQDEDLKRKEFEYADVKKAGEAFLAKNKTKKGVITTKSGLQYVVLKKGKGKKPTAQSKVKIHYHGTFIDGKVFDSSVDRKKPYENAANGFVKGFSEALLLMKTGAKYKVFIPQELGYGANPRGGGIKPFMALVFEVELLEVK